MHSSGVQQAAASAHFAVAAADRGPVAFDCDGFGLGASRSAVAVEIHRFAVSAGADHVLAGFALAADHFVAVGVVGRFSIDPAAAAFDQLRVAGVASVRFSAV